MPRLISVLIAVLGAATVLLAFVGYLTLRDFALNGTATFNPNGHIVLGPLSIGLESALADSTPSRTIDAAAYCVALQNRLIGLALAGLAMLIIAMAITRSTARERRL